MRYPDRLLTDGEEILHQFRPHWKVLIPAIGWAMLLAALTGVAFAAVREYAWWVTLFTVVLWVALSTKALVAWWYTNYVLTNERIIVRSGMVSRSGTEIPLENINNVLFSQSVMERLLGYGDVLVESAGSQGQSRLENIPDPEAFQSEIYRARELRSVDLKGGGGAMRPRDVVEQLEALADLHERGHLTDAEFAGKKRKLLGELPGIDANDVADPPVEADRPDLG
jgi:uncharacterized membrane protein YdbT with pleckstrin-like domain